MITEEQKRNLRLWLFNDGWNDEDVVEAVTAYNKGGAKAAAESVKWMDGNDMYSTYSDEMLKSIMRWENGGKPEVFPMLSIRNRKC